jgi:Mg2+/Co2+ transporter CorB
MANLPIWLHLCALLVLMLVSAFFSIAETALMAVDRLRLRYLVRQGHGGAKRVQALLDRTDRLLSAILIGNNLANTAATSLVAALTIYDFGNQEWILATATLVFAFLLLVFSEITPKIIGATFPEAVALRAGLFLRPILWMTTPVVWFVNLFVQLLLRLMRVRTGPKGGAERLQLSSEELRTLVLEGSSFFPADHRSMLLNVFDLESLSVDDVMTPRANIEGINLEHPVEQIIEQVTTCFHGRLPAYTGDISRVEGMLAVRKLLPELTQGDFSHDRLRERLQAPYWIPTGTPLLRQLQMFQENRQRLGLVVDEYGDLLGLITMDDILEEVVGEFASLTPGAGAVKWDPEGRCLLDGTASLRQLTRKLGLPLPLQGPRTLNGLVLEQLETIPDGPCCVNLPGCHVEILQIHDQLIRSVRLTRIAAIPVHGRTR